MLHIMLPENEDEAELAAESVYEIILVHKVRAFLPHLREIPLEAPPPSRDASAFKSRLCSKRQMIWG